MNRYARLCFLFKIYFFDNGIGFRLQYSMFKMCGKEGKNDEGKEKRVRIFSLVHSCSQFQIALVNQYSDQMIG